MSSIESRSLSPGDKIILACSFLAIVGLVLMIASFSLGAAIHSAKEMSAGNTLAEIVEQATLTVIFIALTAVFPISGIYLSRGLYQRLE